MPEAFVLFKTEPSQEREVYVALSENSAVAEVHALYGEFDLLVRVSSESAKDLTNMLMREFRAISGVRETQTLIAVDY
jgi:DNA-binding Lrp family transcriptional regulator